ncbi:MAG: hypothetical protein R6X06_03600 [Gammaproteobacteria bacterium]
MAEIIARQWLKDVTTTANQKDHAAHMALISKKVSLQGVPGYETIGYDDWAAQTQHEFEDDILKAIRYDGFKLISATDAQIVFKTFETVEANDGTVNAQGVEMSLEKEGDGVWRLVQERILPMDEARLEGLVH